MLIEDIKKHVINHGCNITSETDFSLVASCDDGITLVKFPETRLKTLVNVKEIDFLHGILSPPSAIDVAEIGIGNFKKQGTWSRVIKMSGLDTVEYVMTERNMRNINIPLVKKAVKRIDRANKFAQLHDDAIDPFEIVKDEVQIAAKNITSRIEDNIAGKVGGNVICGMKPVFQRSWNEKDRERYHYLVRVRCNVPSLKEKVTKKIDRIGGWRTMSESDLLWIKSILSPSKDSFLTGIKVKSAHGKSQLEFELVDDDKVKNKDFLDNVKKIRDAMSSSLPVTKEVSVTDIIGDSYDVKKI
jgi:hypothetical protein